MMTSPGLTRSGAQHVVGLDDTDSGGRDVVVVRFHQAGVFGGLAAEQRAARAHASLGDTADDRAQAFRHRPADRDVVLQEQWLGAADHEVVDHHRDQVEADGVVLVHRLGDRQLGTDAVGGRRQHRFAVAAAQGEQSGESAQPATHLGSGGLGRQRLEQIDGAVTGFNVHPGRRVGDALAARVSSGAFSGIRHRDKGYRAALNAGIKRL